MRSLCGIIIILVALSLFVSTTMSKTPIKSLNCNKDKNVKIDSMSKVLQKSGRIAQSNIISQASLNLQVNNPLDSKDSFLLWYTKIFPVYPSEIVKFMSLSVMMFWIIFVFTMTRDTKDALIVTNCGAEAIAFLKVYGVIPAATGFMILYSKMANYLSPNTLFYATLLPFFIFFSVFAFILYPLRNIIHPLHIAVPEGGFSFAVNLLRYWTYSLYFIVSELWGSAGIPLLFWSFANDVVKIDQAKRLYPLMSLVGNLGPILSGITMTLASQYVSKFHTDDDEAMGASLKLLTGTMTAGGVIIAFLHYFIRNLHNRELEEDKKAELLLEELELTAAKAKEANQKQHKRGGGKPSPAPTVIKPVPIVLKEKPKLSFFESLKLLSSDSYLRNVATMVLSYGLAIEFTDIMWKASVKKAFPVKTEYLNFMGRYSTLVGSAACVMMLVGAGTIKGLGWQAGALTTPLMMGILALPFFGFMIFGGTDANNPSNKKPLLMAVYVGLVQNVLSRATKYAIFDPTKEMAYIPLDRESKTKGKAAIDVLGARLGKSGGALAQQLLVIIFGNIMHGAPVVAILFYIVIALWIGAVNDLAPRFKQKEAELKAASAK